MHIGFDDFAKVDMRIGRIVAVDEAATRKAAYRLTVDFGEEIGVKVSCGAYTNYAKEELLGQLVVGVVNLPPKKMGPEKSEVLVLGVPGPDGATIRLQPERSVEPGVKVF